MSESSTVNQESVNSKVDQVVLDFIKDNQVVYVYSCICKTLGHTKSLDVGQVQHALHRLVSAGKLMTVVVVVPDLETPAEPSRITGYCLA